MNMTEWFDTKGEVVATFVVLCGFLGLYVIGCAL